MTDPSKSLGRTYDALVEFTEQLIKAQPDAGVAEYEPTEGEVLVVHAPSGEWDVAQLIDGEWVSTVSELPVYGPPTHWAELLEVPE